MDCSPPGSSVHGILQARVLEWGAVSSSRGSSQPRDHMSDSLRAMDCNPPGSSVHGILQARILEWVAFPFSRGSSQFRIGASCRQVSPGLRQETALLTGLRPPRRSPGLTPHQEPSAGCPLLWSSAWPVSPGEFPGLGASTGLLSHEGRGQCYTLHSSPQALWL